MGIIKQVKEYLFISKRDPNEPRTQWMKYMHGMNRISLIMFLIAVLIILFKSVVLPLMNK
jgi:Ni,Fe-hydrogenase I cytochrome b subunit